jgi:hypothetical protein
VPADEVRSFCKSVSGLHEASSQPKPNKVQTFNARMAEVIGNPAELLRGDGCASRIQTARAPLLLYSSRQ